MLHKRADVPAQRHRLLASRRRARNLTVIGIPHDAPSASRYDANLFGLVHFISLDPYCATSLSIVLHFTSLPSPIVAW